MSLRQAQERLEKSTQCRFSLLVDTLDKDDKAVLKEWIAEGKAGNWISRVLRIEGLVVNDKTVRRHLEGICQCPDNAEFRGAYSVAP